MKIGISGTHSAGKTTLLDALKKESQVYYYQFCPEITRSVRNAGLPINEDGIDLTQELIVNTHIANLMLWDNMITDRTLLDSYVYSQYLFEKGNISKQTLEYAEKALDKFIGMYDLLFFVRPEFGLIEDGVRSTDEKYQRDIHEMMCVAVLEKTQLVNVHLLMGSLEDRLNQFREVYHDYRNS